MSLDKDDNKLMSDMYKMFWAYLHTSGTVLIKRYFSEEDLIEARQSPFVRKLIEPFPAIDITDARRIIEDRLEEGLLDD